MYTNKMYVNKENQNLSEQEKKPEDRLYQSLGQVTEQTQNLALNNLDFTSQKQSRDDVFYDFASQEQSTRERPFEGLTFSNLSPIATSYVPVVPQPGSRLLPDAITRTTAVQTTEPHGSIPSDTQNSGQTQTSDLFHPGSPVNAPQLHYASTNLISLTERSNSYFSYNAEKDLLHKFQSLREKSAMFDVTLCCADDLNPTKVTRIPAHRILLASFSPIFDTICDIAFENQSQAVIYLDGIGQFNLSALLNFMYNGEGSLPPYKVNSFLAAGKHFQIKGIDRVEHYESTVNPIERINTDKSSCNAGVEPNVEPIIVDKSKTKTRAP